MVKRLLAALLLFALPAQAQDLLIEAEVAPGDPLVQAEVIYTARLLRRSSLQHGYLVMPEIPDAMVEPLDEREETVQRSNGTWRLIEKRFALFPQRSGALVIPAPVFSGRDSFARGPELTLSVRAKPAEAPPGWWLPARALTLRDETALPPECAVGMPLDRTIIIEARGLTGAQLPALPLPALPGLRAVRLADVVETTVVEGEVRGRRTERHLLVPEKPGPLSLPALSVAWWDSAAGVARQAELPAQALTVTGAAAARSRKIEPPVPVVEAPETQSQLGRWRSWLLPAAAGLLGMLLIVRLVRTPSWQRHRRVGRALAAVRQACRASDARRTRAALLAWAAECWPGQPPTLPAVAVRLPLTAPLLAELDAAAYGGRMWDGSAWLKQLTPLLHGRKAARPAEPLLPPLGHLAGSDAWAGKMPALPGTSSANPLHRHKRP